MINRYLLAAALLAASAPLLAQEQAGECESNFTVGGSFSAGKTFKSSVEHTGLSYDVVFDKVAAAIEADGLQIIDQSKERGYIRANNPVKGGEGGTSVAPLRVLVLGKPNGNVKVDATFNIAGGQLSPKKAVMKSMCAMLNAPRS
ncbi:MAG TPA: hypothetical protein DDZ67_02800 [Xanthomonadaceae bacterium]|nr:hypothetical protein [Xanthomonadaceae bacterium]